MKRRVTLGIILTLLLTSMLTLAFNIKPVESNWIRTGTIYIRADGSIEPSDAPISKLDNYTYTLTDNIVGNVPLATSAIVVERDNIVIDGAGYTLRGNDANGMNLTRRSNVTIRNMSITAFRIGIHLIESSDNTVFGNNITNNGVGINLYESSKNAISRNNIANAYTGVDLRSGSSNNIVSGNNITNNMDFGVAIVGDRNYSNKFFHNNFINNTQQVGTVMNYDDWNNGYPSGGNYWSDYTGVDEKSGPNQDQPGSDGIGDTSYVEKMPWHMEDKYPLMNPWIPLPVDSTPPTTILPDDYYLWHAADFLLTLTAIDDMSGVAETYYKINDGPTKTVSSDGQPFITTEGANNKLEFWSVDKAGNEELPHKVLTTGIFLDKTKPTANAGTNQTINVGTTINFDAGGSTDNVFIVSYDWNFGDGATGTNKTISHIYTSPGTYTVTLTVEDAAGNTATDLTTITVLPAEAFPIWVIGAAVATITIVAATTLLLRRRNKTVAK